MKTNQLQSKIGGAFLSVSILLGIGFAASITTLAQYRQDGDERRDNDRRHDRDRANNNYYQIAQNQGYQDGLNTGANDASQGKNSNPQRSRLYRNARAGYNSSYGNSNQYQRAYR
jgi:hypothetical protein